MRTLQIKTFAFVSALFLGGCGGGGETPYGGREGEDNGQEGEAEGEGMAFCGDDACNGAESCMSCPDDCKCEDLGICGDGFCSDARCETCARCPEDCGACQEVTCTCGDGTCDNYYCGEHCATCPSDCGTCTGRCGNGSCDYLELCYTCGSDCAGCSCFPGVTCGGDSGQYCWSCQYCGPCPVGCGDGVCGVGEDCSSCNADCGDCSDGCGDGACDGPAGENWERCARDCGTVTARTGYYHCGNGVCESGEDERCGDCGGVAQTCDLACASSCDCEQPWTACGSEIGGLRPVCSPLRCEICFDASQYCCWCPRTVCGNVTCGNSEADCPSC